MNVLIVGGSGFLSGTAARVALREGHDVAIITRGKRPVPAGVRAILADRDQPVAFDAAIAAEPGQWDLVVDCIGFNAAHAEQDLRAFVGRARHLVFISTDSVFNPADRPWKLDESFDRYDTISPYGRGKRAAEVALLGQSDAAASRGTSMTILRPCHIYGPGSLLGCLPEHGRDPNLIAYIRAGIPLRLVGGGQFLQQPIFAEDLAAMAFSCVDSPRVAGQIYLTAGCDVVASREYYGHIADALRVPMPPIEEVTVAALLSEKPHLRHFCCHRVYDMTKSMTDGLAMPKMPLAEGLAIHVRSMLDADRPAS